MLIFIPICVLVLSRIQVWEGRFEDLTFFCRLYFILLFWGGYRTSLPPTSVHIVQSLQVNPFHRINFVFKVREDLGALTSLYLDIQPILFSVTLQLRLSEVPNPEPFWDFAAQNACLLLTHNNLATFFVLVNWSLLTCQSIAFIS